MCLFVYLAAAAPLTEIPWNGTAPAFHVGALPDSEAGVRRHFSLPHVCWIASKEGCGCAIAQAADDEMLDEEDREAGKQARHDLQDYLTAETGRDGALSRYELYTRWADQHELPPESRAAGLVCELQDCPGWFEEGALVTLRF